MRSLKNPRACPGSINDEGSRRELKAYQRGLLEGYEAGIADAEVKFMEVLTDVMRERSGLIEQVENVMPAGRPN